MQLWLDTADIEAIKKANESGILHGVTTNPSIFAAAKTDAESLIKQLLNIQPGLVAIQVTNTSTVSHMVTQASAISALSPERIVIKVPSTLMGFTAMREMKNKNIVVLATAISTITQFVAAATVGADYAALYLSHMQSAGKNIFDEMKSMLALAQNNHWTVNLMGAAFANATTAQETMATGVGSVTVPAAIFDELFTIEPKVAEQLQRFENDWEKYQKTHNAWLLSGSTADKCYI